VFHGTDTFNAAYLANQYGAERPTGTSILALAHRNVQGHTHEKDAFEALNQASQHNSNLAIASYVADCYSFKKALIKLVALAKARPWTTVVVRPDSGPYVQNVLDICETAVEANLHGINDFGEYKATNLRFIQGDSMTPEKVDETFKKLVDEGLAPTQWGIFGVGGYLRNNVTRDSLSSAYKLSARGKNIEPVVKLSEAKGKLSVPGPNEIVRYEDVMDHETKPSTFLMTEHLELVHKPLAAKVFYDGTLEDPFGEVCNESFKTLQDRCINEFDKFFPVRNTFKVLSPAIVAEQERVYKLYQS
jgi:nicotinic acid phosphoribosyltransferase